MPTTSSTSSPKVAIATESGKHAKIAIDCMDYACNIIIEKPIALSIADADAIVEKAEEPKQYGWEKSFHNQLMHISYLLFLLLNSHIFIY